MAVRSRQPRVLDKAIPPPLQPFLRAYVLGYASSTAPRLLTLLLTHLGRNRRYGRKEDAQEREGFADAALRIIRGGLEWQRFPTFCALLVGGSSLLQARDTIGIFLSKVLTCHRFL
jgi:hypothetical protein